MANQKELDKGYMDYIHNTFEYNQDNGKVYWKRTYLTGKEAGGIVTNKAGNKYRIITFTFNGKQKKIMTHRLIWMIVYNRAPREIDHLDGD